jgi:hypothetical protein
MDTGKIKELAQELKSKAQELLNCCDGEGYESEEMGMEGESSEGSGSDKKMAIAAIKKGLTK